LTKVVFNENDTPSTGISNSSGVPFVNAITLPLATFCGNSIKVLIPSIVSSVVLFT
jgi:hypothetical protein